MKTVIIGGGIAGPVVAMALQRVGIEATVYEAHAGPADQRGLFLGLAANGMRVLHSLGALTRVQQADVVPTPSLAFYSTTGKRLGSVDAGSLSEESPSFTVLRATLQQALTEEAQSRGIAIEFGKRFASVQQYDGYVTIQFTDGSSVDAELLIGADGIHSAVRNAMDPSAPPPTYTGLLNLGGFTSKHTLVATTNEMRMIWGRRAFFGYTVAQRGRAWWFANIGVQQEPSREELQQATTAQWKQRLSALFKDDPSLTRELIAQTPEIVATPIHDMPSIPRWSNGRVVLIGDAAHAVSPSSGQGASMALEDALMLATCVENASCVDQALKQYEERRRPRAERIVAMGRRRGAYKAPGPIVRAVRDLFLPIALRLFATKASMEWLFDYEVEWSKAN